MDEFRAGVTASLRSWSALRTAVETGWGGAESIRKAELLRSQIFEIFNGESVPPKSMADVTDLEDALAIFMEEEFSVVLEDRSDKQVADVIWKMYEACAKLGDVQMATQVVAVAEHAAAKLNQGYFPVQIVAPENADDSDDDENDVAHEPTDGTQTMETTTVSVQSDKAMAQSAAGEDRAIDADPAMPVSPQVALLARTSAAEYAAQPLFASTKKRKTLEQPPPRQLGEKPAASLESNEPPADEDGFAPVAKQKRRSRKPV
jgi:pre-rRNA-processing protein TSR2